MLLLALLACPISQDTDTALPPVKPEECSGLVDEDEDGLVDCKDPDCDGECPETCDDGRDNDLDSDIDCADEDCVGEPECLEDCADAADNDLDGDTDCADQDCVGAPECLEDCDDDVDNDLDGYVDCLDYEDCYASKDCIEVCDDGVDNDDDGDLDCDDSECRVHPSCPEICDDGADNDDDGLLDCEDADCLADPTCIETCDDGVDDDQDGLADCEDDDCWATLDCPLVTSTATGGVLNVLSAFFTAEERSCYGGRWYLDYETTRVSGTSITGSAVVDSGSASRTCDWFVGFVQDGNYQSLVRSGFETTGACADLPSSALLPAHLSLKDLSHVNGRGPLGWQPWYAALLTWTRPLSGGGGKGADCTYQTTYGKTVTWGYEFDVSSWARTDARGVLVEGSPMQHP